MLFYFQGFKHYSLWHSPAKGLATRQEINKDSWFLANIIAKMHKKQIFGGFCFLLTESFLSAGCNFVVVRQVLPGCEMNSSLQEFEWKIAAGDLWRRRSGCGLLPSKTAPLGPKKQLHGLLFTLSCKSRHTHDEGGRTRTFICIFLNGPTAGVYIFPGREHRAHLHLCPSSALWCWRIDDYMTSLLLCCW